MEVVRAKTAGFCFGVKRAVHIAAEEGALAKGAPCYTYGPIIHNSIVVEDMRKRGVGVLRNEEELRNLQEGTVIIRSHGVPKRIEDLIKSKGLRYVDATCPFVKKIHRIVHKAGEEGCDVIITGDPLHPEVQGIMGWTTSPVTILSSPEEAKKYRPQAGKKAVLVSQTTFSYRKFQDIVEILREMGYHISVLNTICSATKARQEEAARIAGEVDAMLVIGDSKSSNTQKLFEISKRACNNTYFIQTLDDLELNQLGSSETVGITAGASTPNKIIEEVQKACQI